ncbi:MAG: carboxypeptidase regulatory-like domain-containing protein [Pirellulales bacterium]
MPTTRRTWSLLLVLAICAPWTATHAQAAEASVHGRISGQTAEGEHLGPVAGATVEFLDDQGKSVGQTTTDEAGYYQIRPLRPGQYEYHLAAEGFRTEDAGRGFQLATEGASVLDFVLTQGSDSPDNAAPEVPDPANAKSNRPGKRKPGVPPQPSTPPNSANNPNNDPENTQAAQGEGTLVVRVVERSGNGNVPIPDANVLLRRAVDPRVHHATTNLNGVYGQSATPGTWQVAARAAGYALQSHSPVVVTANKRTQVLIVMSKSSAQPAPNDNQQTSFFGTKGRGSRVVFVVDSSNSMKGGKFKQAKEELLRSVRSLSPPQKFYVLFFSDAMRSMFDPNPPNDLVPADTLNITRLERYLESMELARGTNAHAAMEKAFALKPDVIYILSDGGFTDDTQRYLMQMPTQPARINTVAFRAKERGEASLQRIADKFRGTHTEIP